MQDFFDVKLALENLPFILGGLPMTIAVSFVAMGLARARAIYFLS